MNPREIIERATADGVVLALAGAGEVKATGNHAAIAKWLPTLREHKASIVDVLAEDEILGWLAWIGETDEDVVAEVLTACRRDPEVKDYFLSRAREQCGSALKPAP